jgi:WD40 repeat protein
MELLEDTKELLHNSVISVVFHPSLPFLVTNYSNIDKTVGIIKLWHILDKKLVEYLIIDPCIFVFSVRFNLTGNILATSCSDGTVKLWSISYIENPSAACDVVLDKHSKYAISVGFDPTGTLIATGYDDGIVKIWKISKDEKSVEFVADIEKYIDDEEEKELPELVTQEGIPNAVMAVEFNQTGSLLVAGYNDGTFTMWNILTDKKLFRVGFNMKNNKPVKSIIFHPILKYIAICYENIVEIRGIEYEASPPYDVLKKIERPNYFDSIAFHPTLTVMLTASGDHISKYEFPTDE